MQIKPFLLERFFAKYEFSAPYLLSCSDCEALTLKELLSMADDNSLGYWNKLKLNYTESQGHPVLREEISKLYNTITPDNILTIVPEEGILIAMNSILEKNDHVITTFPGYQSLYEIANSLDCEVSKWMPKYENGFSFDIADFKNQLRENTKLIVINFPHNPTGALIDEDVLKEILTIAKQRNIIVFSDEMYRFLEYDPSNRLPSACDLYENAVSLFGMSKSFALPGLRIGWLTTKNKKLLDKFKVYRDYTTICSSATSEILALIGLRSKETILERNLNLIKNNLNLLDLFFEEFKHLFEWTKPKAGPIAFPKLKIKMPVEEFCYKLVEENGVMLLPSAVYEYESNNFRIGFARKNMNEALEKLKECILTYEKD